MPRLALLALVALFVLAAAAVAHGLASRPDAPVAASPVPMPAPPLREPAAPSAPPPAALLTPPPVAPAAPERPAPAAIRWRESRALGLPDAGRLVNGVRLPREGEHFFTWDPVRKTSPNRPWRRWGTDVLVRKTLRIVRAYRAAHPKAPRAAIGDLSRPRGGDFGKRFGILGHVSHQNGLDVDVYYPRKDRREVAPRRASHVDQRLAQTLVDLFVAAGAEKVFVGPNLRLRGPRAVVQALAHHDDHLHARLPPLTR